MARIDKLEARIEDLEVDLRQRDDQIKELREEVSQARDLVGEMREHVEDARALIESWKESFHMKLADNDMWVFDESEVWEYYADLSEQHEKLVREWNKFTAEYNAVVAPREVGRPLEASEAQVKEALKLRKTGISQRSIAAQTGLGPQTVRTILGKDRGTDRTSKRTNLLRKREFDRLRAAEFRVRKKGRDLLPKRISQTLKEGERLIRAAKGLDD